MPINIFSSDTFEGANSELLEKLKADYTGDGEHIIIVPDRFALTFEAKVMKALGREACFGIKVYSFARLARKYALGKRKCLTPEASVMLLARIILENNDKLQFLSSKNSNFANDMYAVLTEIRNSGISSHELKKASEKMHGSMAKKTADIALLYDKYLEALSGDYSDSGTLLEGFCKNVIENYELRKAHIYIAEFFDFNGMQYKVLRSLIAASASFNIALVESYNRANSRIFPSRIEKKLRSFGSEFNLSVSKFTKNEVLVPQKRRLLENLFSYAKIKNTDSGEGESFAEIYKAASIEIEVDHICKEICKIVREEDKRYKDIAVVAGKIEETASIYKKYFERYGIPFFIDEKKHLAAHPAARLIKSALRVVEKNFRSNEVFEYLKNPLLGIDFLSVSKFENYCLKYSINYNRFLEEFGLGDFEASEALRQKFASDLKSLDSTNKITTFSDGVCRVREFLRCVNFDASMEVLANKQMLAGELSEAEVTRVARIKIIGILDEIEEIFASRKTSLEEFYFILCSAIDSINFALSLVQNDCVFIGGVGESRYDNTQVMFVSSATEGAIPNVVSYLGILGQKECNALKENELEIYPDAKEQTLLEKFYALQIFLKPRERLVFTYHTQWEKGQCLPASFLAQVEEICNTKVVNITNLISKNCNGESEFLVKCLANSNNARLLLAEDEGRRKSFSYSRQMPELAKFFDSLKVYFGKCKHPDDCIEKTLSNADCYMWRQEENKLYSSASKIERYLSCPFKNFVASVLGAKERENGSLSVLEKGTIFHELLEKLFKTQPTLDCGKKELSLLVEAILGKILSREEFFYFVKNKDNYGHIKELFADCQVLAETLAKKMKSYNLAPYLLEAGFGKGGEFREMEIDIGNKKIYLTGKIDRIDKADDDFAIIDYKSASTVNFGLREVYFGERIQLFTYLNALLQNKVGNPIGLFYLPLSLKYRNAESEGERLRYSGFLIEDAEKILMMDSSIKVGEGKGGGLLAVSIKTTKKGDYKISGTKTLSSDNFKIVADYVLDICKQAVLEMSEGNIEPSPKSCKYCSYANICKRERYGIDERGKAKGKVSVDSFRTQKSESRRTKDE